MKISDMITPAQDPAGKLAEFTANLKYEDIPAEQADYIKRDILDAMSSMLGGSTGPAVAQTMNYVRSMADSGKARVAVYGDALPPTLAAYANGVIARAVDLGDTGVTGGHICEWIAPTLLAYLSYTDQKISGKELITAFAAGAEWGAREHTCMRLQYNTTTSPGECGGSRYATIFLAKLAGLNKDQIWDAAGMSFQAHAATTQQKYNEGTPDVRLQHGYIASDAITAVELVKQGLPSVHGIYMGVGGMMKNCCHDDIYDPDFLTADLGKKWVWKDNITNKLYGGCYYNHTPIYGILNLMKDHGIAKEDIESIHITTSMGCRCTTNPIEEKQYPRTPEEALFSNPYAATYAIFTGDCFIDAFHEDNYEKMMADPEFVDFMKKFSYTATPEITTAFDNYPIEITLKDGRKFSKVEGDLPGNQKNPMTWEQAIAKFEKVQKFSAVDLGKAKYDKVIEICRNLENVDDVRVLFEAMVP